MVLLWLSISKMRPSTANKKWSIASQVSKLLGVAVEKGKKSSESAEKRNMGRIKDGRKE